MNKFKLTSLLIFLLATGRPLTTLAQPIDAVAGSEARVLGLTEFLSLVGENSPERENILIDALTLQYQEALRLPARDLVLGVRQEHEFFLEQGRNAPATTISLSKLFPLSGTEISAAYGASSSFSSDQRSSSLGAELIQPLARNAFGKSTRLLKKIVGLETEVAEFQIVESYEDFTALILRTYMDWRASYENLQIGRSSYKENLKLLDNIQDRRKSSIALPIDVNKIKLQVLARRENLISLEEEYDSLLNDIKRFSGISEPVIPEEITKMALGDQPFEDQIERFLNEGRTFIILRKLEDRSELNLAREANELLPSLDLVLGYDVQGETGGLKNDDDKATVGLSLEWPFPNQIAQAEKAVAEIIKEKSALNTLSAQARLESTLRSLSREIEKEKSLGVIADEKLALSEKILAAESENYTFGKVSLNDYIQAVNIRDSNRFNKVLREVLLEKLTLEWLRLTDQLVQKSPLQAP